MLDRRAHPEDRRSFLVELTDEGSDIARRVRDEIEDLESKISELVPGGKMEGFEALLEAIARATEIQVR